MDQTIQSSGVLQFHSLVQLLGTRGQDQQKRSWSSFGFGFGLVDILSSCQIRFHLFVRFSAADLGEVYYELLSPPFGE